MDPSTTVNTSNNEANISITEEQVNKEETTIQSPLKGTPNILFEKKSNSQQHQPSVCNNLNGQKESDVGTTSLEETKDSNSDTDSESCTTTKEHKTPHSRKDDKPEKSRTSKRKSSCKKDFGSPTKCRKVPLPLLNWADSKEVWMFMVYKEEAALHLRNPHLFEDVSTNFMPRMRAILLDWLMEVCEVYHLRRVTYYLAVDYFDRFISLKPDIPKSQLQLVGVTCLFLSAKLEEIYPPGISEFSYVCDGACSASDILDCELLVLNGLGWDLNVMTPSDWLNLYMQLHFQAPVVIKQKLHHESTRNFLFPQYSGYQFSRASQMIDVFSLDPGFLKFSYSAIGASAMYFMYGKQAALDVSGYTWDELQPCAEYMAAFYLVLRDTSDPKLISCKADHVPEDRGHLASLRKNIPTLVKDENHSLQTHVVNMDYFERAAIIRLEQMGLKVERTYINKSKLSETDEQQLLKESNNDSPENTSTDYSNSDDETKENSKTKIEVEDDESIVCMYDIEKVPCDAIALDDSNISISSVSSHDADIILPDDRALLSFDQILSGIVKCNQKNIVVKKNGITNNFLKNDEETSD